MSPPNYESASANTKPKRIQAASLLATNIDQLVYFEPFDSITEAIARETRIKNMGRTEKIQLIVSLNRTWRDLSDDWDLPMTPFDETKLRAPTTF